MFTGTEMLQKFTNKSSYDKRCLRVMFSSRDASVGLFG